MKDEMPLLCEANGGAIDMGIGQNVLKFAAEHHPGFYAPDKRPDGPNVIVTDAAAFAQEVVLEMNRENEIGETLLTDMLDAAIKRAVENGCFGVKHE